MTLRLHSPRANCLQSLLCAAKHAQAVLGPFLLVECRSASAERIEEALARSLENIDTLRRELEDAIADCQLADRVRRDIAAGLRHDGDSLARVTAAEAEALEQGWYSYTPDHDSAPHPVGVGACDIAVHAAANTSLDERRAC